MLPGFNFRGVAAAEILVHFFKEAFDLLAECIIERDTFAPTCLTVEQRSFRNSAAEHFLKTHGLCAELQSILVFCLFFASLILDRIRLPKAFLACQTSTVLASMELDYIAGSADPQLRRRNTQTTDDKSIASSLPQRLIMRPLVQDISFYGADVILPLLLDVDQCPLPAAKRKVLQAGELEVVGVVICHQ